MLYLNVDVLLWSMFIPWPRPQTKLHLIFFFAHAWGGVSYISKNNVPKCKLHFGEVSKKVNYIYKGPPNLLA